MQCLHITLPIWSLLTLQVCAAQPEVFCDSPDFKRGEAYEVSQDELQKLLDTHDHLPEIYERMKGKCDHVQTR